MIVVFLCLLFVCSFLIPSSFFPHSFLILSLFFPYSFLVLVRSCSFLFVLIYFLSISYLFLIYLVLDHITLPLFLQTLVLYGLRECLRDPREGILLSCNLSLVLFVFVAGGRAQREGAAAPP